MNKFNPDTFNATKFAEAMQAEFSMTAYRSNDCSVDADYENLQITQDGQFAIVKINICSPFWDELLLNSQPDCFKADKIRFGLTLNMRVMLFHYSKMQTFNMLNIVSENYDPLNYLQDLYMELHSGHFVKRVPISEFNDTDANTIKQMFSRIYMPFLLINYLAYKFQAENNKVKVGFKIAHKKALLTQSVKKLGEKHFEAVLQLKDGSTVKRYTPAYSIKNAIDLLTFDFKDFEDFEILEIKQVAYDPNKSLS